MNEKPTLIEGNLENLFERPQGLVEQPRPVVMQPRQWYIPDAVQAYRMRREMRRIRRDGK